FNIPQPLERKTKLGDILSGIEPLFVDIEHQVQKDLFGETIPQRNMSLSNNNGFNDYFLFNDLRNGHSTVHSWDIIDTTDRQKTICYLLLKNRRKSIYGKLDGNPLSLEHFKSLDSSVTQEELNELVNINILKREEYCFTVSPNRETRLTEEENSVLKLNFVNRLIVDDLKNNRILKLKKINIKKTLSSLKQKNIIKCDEIRYDFKNTKISTGLFGINRIFLPSSNIFPTLVASDSNDYITLKEIKATSIEDYKSQFIEEIYKKGNYRKLTKNETCIIQGFPEDFILPGSRARWMKLLGNSVSVPVIEMLGKAILKTGVFDMEKEIAIY
ncbi:MAG: DNA (cytosine-5-)-methyltransferase, partial [Bacteroidetes bacterium]